MAPRSSQCSNVETPMPKYHAVLLFDCPERIISMIWSCSSGVNLDFRPALLFFFLGGSGVAGSGIDSGSGAAECSSLMCCSTGTPGRVTQPLERRTSGISCHMDLSSVVRSCLWHFQHHSIMARP